MNIGIVAPFNPYSVSSYFATNTRIPDVNQNASSVNTLVEELLSQGHTVTVFTYVTDHRFIPQIVEGKRIKVYILSSRTIIPKMGLFVRLYMPFKLRSVINNEISKLDVLHAHWTYDYALAAQHFCNCKPVYCTVRDWCPKILRQQKSPLQILYWILSWFVFKIVMSNKYTHFIANSYYTEKMLKNSYPQLKVSLNFNPIKKEYILSKRCSTPKGISFVSVADRLSNPGKNIITLLVAFKQFRKKYPNSHLILIGKGGEDGSIFRKQCGENGLLNGVVFKGFVSRMEINSILDSSTCLVHPSLEETFGNTLIEAMSRCVPVIGGKNSGAVPYILENGEIGLLCDVNNSQSICEAMETVLDEALQTKLTHRATSHLKEKYSSDKVVKQLIDIYESHNRN